MASAKGKHPSRAPMTGLTLSTLTNVNIGRHFSSEVHTDPNFGIKKFSTKWVLSDKLGISNSAIHAAEFALAS